MKIIKYIIILIGITKFLIAQDTPVNLETETIDHSSIQLNWNIWDPADSYFSNIIFISNIEDNGNGTIVMEFYLENDATISSFNLSLESDIYISDVELTSNSLDNIGFIITHEEGNLGDFTISGNNTGQNIPTDFGILLQLTGNYDPDHGDESQFFINYSESNFIDNNIEHLSYKWKNIVWEVGTGIAPDICGDGVCTINENYSICPQECELDITYSIYFENNPQLIAQTSSNNSIIQNLIPITPYCFEVVATENNSNVNEISNIACSTTNCVEQNWCQDLDGDGYGNPAILISSCQPISNFVAECTDEDDSSYCLSNSFDFCGVCNGPNECNYVEDPDYPGICQCGNGEDSCWTEGSTSSGYIIDCSGTCSGVAEKDDCGVCTGGNTLNSFNGSQDCYDTCSPTDPESLSSCDNGLGFNEQGQECLSYLGAGSGVDQCGICGGNNSACFPYFEGPTNLLAQATNLQIGLSWDPVNLCDPYIYDCDWGDENQSLSENPINSNYSRNETTLNSKLSIDQIVDDGQGTVSFYINLQADSDVYSARFNLDILDIYDTLSVFQDFPNINDLATNTTDCSGNTCVQFGQPAGGILDNEDFDFSGYTQMDGSANLQSFSGDFINQEILQAGTTLFRMDATYDPIALAGKELFVTHTLTIQTESDTLVVFTENYENLTTRFNTSVWQVGFGLSSIFSCGDGICQEPFEEPGDDLMSGIDGYPTACGTGLTEYFLGVGVIGDCIPPQFCGDEICQDESYCEFVDNILECGYTDGAPHEYDNESWQNCNLDCYSCGNGICDWDNYENYCDEIPNNDIPDCTNIPINYLSCIDGEFYSEINDGVWGDCMEPFEVVYTIYKDNVIYSSEESCIANSGYWLGECFTPLISTTNTQFNDVGLDYLEDHCYFIEAKQGELTTTIAQNSNISCDQTNPQIGELPVIRRIDDMPGDQGGYVKLTVQRSYSDNGTVDSLYQVYRKFQESNWTHVGSFPGTGEQSYFFISPTLEDSVPSNPNYHNFKVYYRGYIDSSAFSNFPEYGYSIDNIAPSTPTGLSLELGNDNILLNWNPVFENDFSHYSIYRNNYNVNNPSTHSYIDNNYTENGGFNFGELLQYQIGAFDIHGNESILSDIEMTSYGLLGNVTYQDIFLYGENNLNDPLSDSTLIDILDISMAQSIACSQFDVCDQNINNNSMSNPSDYEIWASDMNFDDIVNVSDLSCLVYYIQNGLVCPTENAVSINISPNYESKIIQFNADSIHRFEILVDENIHILNHNLPESWIIIQNKNSINAYSPFNIPFNGKLEIEFGKIIKINSISTYSYK